MLGAGDCGPEMEDSTGARSVGKQVKGAYCPALPHLHSAQLQLKGSQKQKERQPEPPVSCLSGVHLNRFSQLGGQFSNEFSHLLNATTLKLDSVAAARRGGGKRGQKPLSRKCAGVETHRLGMPVISALRLPSGAASLVRKSGR